MTSIWVMRQPRMISGTSSKRTWKTNPPFGGVIMTEHVEDHETPATRWVTAEEVQAIGYGLHIGDHELPQLAVLIAHAEDMILARVPRVLERITSGALSLATVRNVVVNMVLRVVRNPGGVQSDSTAGVSTSYWRATASGAVELLQEDLAQLMPKTRRYG